jgi:putative iron-dependent peroxidase
MTQPGILAPLTPHFRFLHFDIKREDQVAESLARLQKAAWGQDVIGLGPELVARLGATVPGLRPFPQFSGSKVALPINQHALVYILRGQEQSTLMDRTLDVERLLAPGFFLRDSEDAFKYKEGRDFSGYEDGTENPEERAEEVALIHGRGPGLDGGSMLALQIYIHDLPALFERDPQAQDHIIGRSRLDNEELDDAPETAHVKRAAQESFEPEAFMIRRSVPYTKGLEKGLVFVAYGRSLDAFDAVLKRMVGAEDGLVDALFSFTRPRSGATYFCPPLSGQHLDLSALLR